MGERPIDAFASALARALTAAERTALEPALEHAIEAARAEYPEVAQPAERFAAELAHKMAREEPLPDALGRLHATDLYLAGACAEGEPRAIAALDARYLAALPSWLARMRLSREELDEIKQLVRERILLRGEDGAPPRISQYSGRGELGSWIRVASTRIALNTRRGVRRARLLEDEVLETLGSDGGDAELARLKVLYQREFRAALASAIASLDRRERTLLRQHHIEGLGIGEIAALYRVHRVTSARWLEGARDGLVAAVRRELASRLQVEGVELESILRLVQSSLHASMSRLLRTDASDAI